MSRTTLFIFGLLFAICLGACTETREELLIRGNIALWDKQPDEAIKQFEKILAIDAKDVDALRGSANAFSQKQDLVKQEEHLLKAYALPEVRPAEKQFLADELEKLYLDLAEKSKSDEQAYEKNLKNALVYNEQSKAAVLLARLFFERGQKLTEAGRLAEAVAEYDRILDLPMEGKMQGQAESAKDLARLGILKEKFGIIFEGRKADLSRQGLFDPARNRWLATATITLPPDIQPTDPAVADKAAAIGSHEAYKQLLSLLATQLGTTVPEPLPQMNFGSWNVERADWVRKGIEFRLVASITFEDGLQAMYFLQKIDEARKAAAAVPPAAAPPAGGTGVAATPQTDGAAPPPASATAAAPPPAAAASAEPAPAVPPGAIPAIVPAAVPAAAPPAVPAAAPPAVPAAAPPAVPAAAPPEAPAVVAPAPATPPVAPPVPSTPAPTPPPTAAPQP